MKGEEICKRELCTGCMACYNICPKSCITMADGKLGQIQPDVNESICIDCGLCKKVCPSGEQQSLVKPSTVYAGWHKDREQYLSSTSGGAAAAFAQLIIRRSGVVYGCESAENLVVKHVRVVDEDQLCRLKGSKYVQSNIGNTYQAAKRDLMDGREVLFIGTPCQIAGLKSYLKKDYEKLYCVDLICHGVPSQSLLRQHIKHIVGDRARRVVFRHGNDCALRIFDVKGDMIYYSNVWRERYKDVYFSAFMDGFTYRDSCYECKFARPERGSDVTVGDFWGLGDDIPHDNVNGCSCILVNTTKGHKLVDEAQLELYERTLDEAVKGNEQLRHPKWMSRKAKVFRALVPKIGLNAAYRLCECDNIINTRFVKPIRRRLKI